MDLSHNEISLAKQLQTCACNIVTSQPISLHLIKAFQSRIPQFVYLIGEGDSKQYVEELFSMGVQCLLMSEKSGKDLEKLKFKYLDYGKIHTTNLGKKEKLEFVKNLNLDNLYYRSNKYLIHDGNAYYGEAAFKENRPAKEIGDKSFQKVIDSHTFWKESDNFMFAIKR